MRKKLRVFRDRRLTPDEVREDVELRRQIEKEFPTRDTAVVAQANSLSEMLRRSIRESGRSIEEVADAAGVSPTVIAVFLSGQRDIHMATADRLARSLGLEVTAD